MKKTYIAPCTTVVKLGNRTIIAASFGMYSNTDVTSMGVRGREWDDEDEDW